ncbi:hypothetical protein EI94DRAFT_1702061 [Lactarius quietus]|nr:hypothetical protein EI94DRAFT_1702061 [Lactarius quietus]
MSAILPPIPPNITEIFLASFVASRDRLEWCLYGTLIVQFYVYSYNFPSDSRFLKLLVRCVLFIETLQTALSGADLYYWFATGFGDMHHLASPYASAFDVPIIGSIVSLTVQFFFAYRLWVLGNREYWWLSALICVVSSVDATAAFAGVSIRAWLRSMQEHVQRDFASGRWLKILAMTWLIGNTVSDTLIASAMLYHLVKLKKRDGRFSSHALCPAASSYAGLAAIVSFVATFMVVLYSDKNWHVCPTAIIGKLYSNTLLVSLNNRVSIRAARAARGPVRSHGGTFPSSGRSEGTEEIVLMDMEKPGKIHPLAQNGMVINIA